MHTLKVFVEASQGFGFYASFYASNVIVSCKQGNSFFIKSVYRSDTVQEKTREKEITDYDYIFVYFVRVPELLYSARMYQNIHLSKHLLKVNYKDILVIILNTNFSG